MRVWRWGCGWISVLASREEVVCWERKGRLGGRGLKGKEEKNSFFFVDEITRFCGADYFSQRTLGAPQQEVCWAFAEAVDGYFVLGRGRGRGRG